MYKRFRDALANARNLVQYRKDKIILVILYILLFALLMGTRSMIDVISYDGLSFSYQETFRSEFADVDDSCAITSGVLTCDEEETYKVYEEIGMAFYIDSYDAFSTERYEESNYSIVMHNDSIRFIFNGLVMYEQQISEMSSSLANIDFALQESDPDFFYDQLIAGVDEYLTNTKWTWGIGLILADIIMGFFVFIFFVMVNSFFMRRRFLMFKFKEIFVMTAYASTSLFVVLIFDAMFQFSFIVTLLLIFIAFRQNSQLNDELNRRVAHHLLIQKKQKAALFDEDETEEDASDNEQSDDDDMFKD